MEKYTPRERFMLAMKCKEVDRPPVAGMTTTATTELMDKVGYSWPEAHKSGKEMAALALGVYDFFGLESIRVPYCLSYEAEALGCRVFLGKKNSTPMVKDSPYKNNPDAKLELPDPKKLMSLARNSAVSEAVEIIVKNRKDLPTLCGVTGPFTIAGHLAGTENLILWTLTEPATAKRFAKFAADYEKMWLEHVDTLGVDSIQMSEPTASWDMISPEMFDEYAVPNLKYVYKPMKNTMQILHICGNMLPMLPEMVKAGATGLSLEEKTDSYKAVEFVNKRAALIGNVGVVKPLLMGTPDDVRAAAKHSADAGFNIISAGCGMSALIKKENVWAMVDEIKHWKKP
jgi:[methyl-Co(III) methanol-specific corrinoid protein]:coenzyme M methyltransferase